MGHRAVSSTIKVWNLTFHILINHLSIKVRYSYTVELRPGNGDNEDFEFELPEDQILPTGEETLQFFIAAAKHLMKVLDIRFVEDR